MEFRALIAFLLVSSSISGCLGVTEERDEDTGVLPILEDPCMTPSDAVTQSLTSIEGNGVERAFRLSVPRSEQGTSLPLVIAFHGGTDSQEDFAQQEQFDQLGEQEKFIMAYAIAEQDRTAAEGEWFLNTAATSKEANNFAEEMCHWAASSEGTAPSLTAASTIKRACLFGVSLSPILSLVMGLL